jgi:hypothetical protein
MTTANFIARYRRQGSSKQLSFLLVLFAVVVGSLSVAASPIIKQAAPIAQHGKAPATERLSPDELYIHSLQQAMVEATQWAHDKPNDEVLWARLHLSLENILYGEWIKGRLLGAKPNEAYFVHCGRNTMTQNDIDIGRVICSVGIALLRPAEFSVFRYEQRTAAH